jgi:hypothetical protein
MMQRQQKPPLDKIRLLGMGRWAPVKKDTLDALAAEIVHNYRSGFAVVGIASVDVDDAVDFASSLAAALEDAGRRVRVVRLDLDSATIPSRIDDDADMLNIVTGSVTTKPSIVSQFHFTIWLENADAHGLDRTARAAASAIVDISDAEHPRRVFADSC